MEIDNHDIITMREKYPAFKILEHKKEYIFTGELYLNHIYNGVRMTGKFNLEITVFKDYSSPIPIVKEVSNRIDKNYPHRYNNGQLCLASDFELKIYFSQNTDISSFVDMYIIPYLYTYRYYEVKQLKQFKADTIYEKKKHYNAAERKRRYYKILSFTQIFLNAITGTTLLTLVFGKGSKVAEIIALILTIIATVLASIQKIGDYEKQAQGNAKVADMYLRISKKISLTLGLSQ